MGKKKKNSNAKFLILFVVVCAIAIGLLVLEIFSFANKSKEMTEAKKTVETVAEEKEKQEVNFDSFIADKVYSSASDIEKMSNDEVLELVSNAKPRNEIKYSRFLDSANTEKGAFENVKFASKEIDSGNFIEQTKMYEDDELFYGVFALVKNVNERREEYIEQRFFVPKKDFYDSKRKALNMDNYEKTKRLLDYKTSIEKSNILLIQSFFERQDDGCHYVVYGISSLYDESLNKTEYKLEKYTTLINSATGIIESETQDVIKDKIYSK